MRDAALQALLERHKGRFPRGLGGEQIDGVDLVMLDADICGIASHYDRNSRSVSAEHRRMLEELILDLERISPDLPSEEARDFYTAARGVADYLLRVR
jgi:hypothetical protein